MEWSMIDQFAKQGGGQWPPFRGALTARHPHQRPITHPESCTCRANRIFRSTTAPLDPAANLPER